MHSQVLEDSELEFWRAFEAEEGEHQYKFRLGPGDWWALDESQPIVDDGFGNRNNVLHIEAPMSSKSVPAQSRPASMEVTTPRQSLEQVEQHTPPMQDDPLGISQESPQRPAPVRLDDGKQVVTQLRVGPSEPLTPPMTPDMGEKLVMDSSKFQPFPAAEIQRPASVASHYSDKSLEEGLPLEEETDEKVITIQPSASENKQRMGMIESIKYFLITLGTWMFNIFGGSMRATGILAIFVGLAAVIYKIRDVRNAIMPFVLSMLYPQTYGRRSGNDTSMV